jgi:hypothetical protein
MNELEAEPDDLIVYDLPENPFLSYKTKSKENGTLFIKTDIKFKT